MATLDDINLFANGGPTDDAMGKKIDEYYAKNNPNSYQNRPMMTPGFFDAEQAVETAKARKILAEELDAGNIKKAYEEGFTQLPIVEQGLGYIFPPTGVPIESYETGYFTDQAGFGMKSPQEFALDVLNPNKNIFQKTPIKAEDPMSGVLAPLSALGALGGIGELANIPKAGLMALRRYQQKTMDGGGGGIGALPEPKQEPSLDTAGYKSNTLEEAKSVSGELSPKALLQYVKSNKRTNPSNNKTGTALKQSEIDEIDFEAFEAQYPNKDYTNEDILQYIDDNRIQLYRVSRSEDNPTYTTGGVGSDSIDLELDEPLTLQIRSEDVDNYASEYEYFIEKQKNFLQEHFPEGVITKENYNNFVQKQEELIQRTDVDLPGQAPSQLTNEFLANTDGGTNPFARYNEPQFNVYKDGVLVNDKSVNDIFVPEHVGTILDGANIDASDIMRTLEDGYTLVPKVLDDSFDADGLITDAATTRADQAYQDGYGNEAYRFVGRDDIYEVIGSEADGYFVRRNGNIDDINFGEDMSLDEARIQIGQYEGNSIGQLDDAYSPDALKDILPEDVISGNATINTKYEGYSGYRLPMGGATDYQEHTLHLNNPKTPTRYTGDMGTKHLGGGDELLHYRTSIRTDENGKKVLFVEEIQSDLHSTARSTTNSSTYEVPAKERQKIEKQLEQEFGLTSNNTEGNRGFGNFFYRGEPGTGGEKMMDIGSLPAIARDIKEGRTANFGSKNADDFVANFGMEKTQEIGDLVAKLQEGALPDFPYKKDWVDAAVKDAIKLGAELGVDRVAFTNAATQIKRNNKRLNYVQDTVIEKVPTREEIKNSKEFAEKVQEELNGAYIDFTNFGDVPTSNTNKFENLPIPSQEEFFADMPNKKRRVDVLNNQSIKIIDDMYQKLNDDLTRFMLKYPEVNKEYIEVQLDGSARGIVDAYKAISAAEVTELSRRANVDFDVLSDPRNIDVTNPALARLLDADLSFREKPKFINDSISKLRQLADERNYLNSFLEYDIEKIRGKALEDLEIKYGTGRYEYKLENVGYELEGDEIYNNNVGFQNFLEGDDYDNQRFGQRLLTNDEELLAEIPEKYKEQVMKDLASGKDNITLNIDDLEGSGKKFLEIYKNEIPRGINKALKDLKVKDVKPSISEVLYSDTVPDTSDQLYKNFIENKNRRKIENEEGVLLNQDVRDPLTHSSIGIDITPEMRQKIIAEGFPSMYMGGKVTKSNSMDRPIEGNRREM